jgi:hypothetical protein
MPRRSSRKQRGGDGSAPEEGFFGNLFNSVKGAVTGVVGDMAEGVKEKVTGALPEAKQMLNTGSASKLGLAPENTGMTMGGGRRRRRKTGNRRTKRRV